ncbi:MarR family winged helix-turn-helix transcriptional regulator [Hyphomonas atlantica]|uniref:MarR family winged helix-turn-helix transcriptional regulator n=1 Tax=Hyphomonas atlantica TaxID=1280948 RepID=UPI0035161FB9
MPDEISQDSYVTEADEIVFLVEEVPRKLRKVFDASTAKFGLSRTQWRAIAYLYRSPGLTQTELARHLDLERASVGHVIDQLEEAHFVERRSIEGNRRVWSLHLLPKAIEILPSLRLEADAIYTQLLTGISATELATVKNLLVKLSGNLAD